MKNIFILLLHDFLFAFRSKSFFLVLFIPLFVFFSEKILDQTKRETEKFRIALVKTSTYPAAMMNALHSAERNIETTWVQNEAEAQELLTEHRVQGVIVEVQPQSEKLKLLVLRKDSPQALGLVQFFSALQKATEKNNPDWVSEVAPLHEAGLQRQALPTWVLMLVLLIGFIILPSQVAEEKEKKLILALLQSPITEGQWITSKSLLGILLTVAAVLFLTALSQFVPERPFLSLGFLALGGYCFSAFGIFLGLLCRHQAGARTLGFIFYLPLLLPSALADFSEKLTRIAPFIPSYQFYGPLRSLFFSTGESLHLLFSSVSLFVLGSILLCLSYLLLSKRWLM